MWIFLNNAFVSIVSKGEDCNKLCVRARRRRDLKELFPDANIIEGVGTDYCFRVFVEREAVASIICSRIESLFYENFCEMRDKELYRSYNQVWSIINELDKDC